MADKMEHEIGAKFEEILGAMAVDKQNSTNSRLSELENVLSRFGFLMTTAVLLAIILGIASAIIICKSITRPISQVITGLRDIAEGDLTRRLEIKSKDETGGLSNLSEKLKGLVQKFKI